MLKYNLNVNNKNGIMKKLDTLFNPLLEDEEKREKRKSFWALFRR